MGILRKAIIPYLCFVALVQAADPPADVDAALRSRVKEFYDLQVARKYRPAEQLVAEDTKDFYYASKKPDIKAITIKEIQYAPDFKSAKVMLLSKMMVMFIGAPPTIMDIPFTSYWKIDEGKWCWWVDQSKLLDTPFGRVHPSSDVSKEDAAKVLSRLSSVSQMSGVQADRLRIPLDPEHPKPETVVLKNTLPGPVTIQSMTSSPALKIEIEKADLGAEESTQVTITPLAGSTDRPEQVVLKIGPLGQMIPITLDYPAAK
jgi:hypothetical protein